MDKSNSLAAIFIALTSMIAVAVMNITMSLSVPELFYAMAGWAVLNGLVCTPLWLKGGRRGFVAGAAVFIVTILALTALVIPTNVSTPNASCNPSYGCTTATLQ